jgi:hypothetical protein
VFRTGVVIRKQTSSPSMHTLATKPAAEPTSSLTDTRTNGQERGGLLLSSNLILRFACPLSAVCHILSLLLVLAEACEARRSSSD